MNKGLRPLFHFFFPSALRDLAPFIGHPPDPSTAVPASQLPLPTLRDPLAWLRLSLIPGITPAMQQALLRALGSPEEVLASPSSRVAVIAGDEAAKRLAAGPAPALLDATLRWLEGAGHHLIALGEDAYPRALLEIPDPPTVVYAIGRTELLNAPSIAIVGSRNATPQGVRDAAAFARALSDAGLCVVSGLALGIDASAHAGGLAGRSSTVAVMGTGADRVYPARNRGLAREIAARGCLLTEFALGIGPVAENFPRRNRLISGLARGVLVVEAADKSGSFITARLAAEQGREVFAIPGSIHSPLAKGCHILIKQGAMLVDDARDVLVELGMAPAGEAPVGRPPPESVDPLLDAMGFAPLTVDQIALLTGEGAPKISARLSRLEIDGRVEALAGGRYQRLETPA